MGEQSPENEQPGTNDGHPAWQEILDAIPDPALQELVKPKLEAWDQGVQQKLQQVREPYQPYQELVENEVDPEQVKQALYIAHLLNTDPNAVVSKAIESFGLDYVPKSQVPSTPLSSNTNSDDDFEFEDAETVDITKHPAFQALQQQLEQVNGKLTQQEQQEQYEQQQQEWDAYLKTLHEDPNVGEFDDDYVTALVANGATVENAIKDFQDRVKSFAEKAYPNQQQQPAPQAPAVMSGNAGIGTGTPASDVRMGDLDKGQVNDVVQQFLARAQAAES